MKKLITIVFIIISFNSCGSGGSSSSNSNENNKENINNPNLPTTVTKKNPYSKYAWHINKNIDKTFKNRYDINENSHINMTEQNFKENQEAIKVAIIDEDFEITHPEIKDKIFATYNVMNNSRNVSNTSISEYSHGTAVAGFIASNTLGVAPNSKLILINIDLKEEIDSPSTLTEFDLIKAFYKAKELGAKVINCSWGAEEGRISQELKSTIESLVRAGITIVFASGNEGKNLDFQNLLENKLDSVITVGATSIRNDVTSYSNYGRAVDILAPGGGDVSNNLIGILGLDKVGEKGENPYFDENKYIPGNDLISKNYSFTQGTSFSTPIVSGAIALLLNENPRLTPNQIRTILIKSADKIGIENGASYINGFNYKRAYGKLNITKALTLAKDFK